MGAFDYICDVPKCSNDVLCGWRDTTSGKGLKTCEGHLHKHNDLNDPFDFFQLLNIPKPDLESITMKKKKQKKTKESKPSIGDGIVALFKTKTMTMTQRDVLSKLNKGKKGDKKISIYGVRAAVKSLISSKQLVVAKKVERQFVLRKGAAANRKK